MFKVFLQKAKIKEENGKLNDAIADYSKALDYEYVHTIGHVKIGIIFLCIENSQ